MVEGEIKFAGSNFKVSKGEIFYINKGKYTVFGSGLVHFGGFEVQ